MDTGSEQSRRARRGPPVPRSGAAAATLRLVHQELLDGVRRERTREQEPLAEIALLALELLELCRLLDALAERLEPEIPAEQDEHADERRRLGRMRDPGDERA